MMKPQTLEKIRQVKEIMEREHIPATEAVRRVGVSIQTWYARNKQRNKPQTPTPEREIEVVNLLKSILNSQLEPKQKLVVVRALLESKHRKGDDSVFKVQQDAPHPRN